MGYMLNNYGGNVYCVGSNYVWGWESNRLMRECMSHHGGAVCAERYLPVGSVDVKAIIQDIVEKRPAFIYSSLIGVSSVEFMKALYEARSDGSSLSIEAMPVCSNTLSEPELVQLGPEAGRGHIASSAYFQSIERIENQAFVRNYKRIYGPHLVTSADAEAAYNACYLLARAIRGAGSDQMAPVVKSLYETKLEAPQGTVWIDRRNNHSYLTPTLGISNAQGQFDVIESYPAAIRPDPYLIDFDVDSLAQPGIITREGKPLRVIQNIPGGL